MAYEVLHDAEALKRPDFSCCPYDFHEDWLDPLDEEFESAESAEN